VVQFFKIFTNMPLKYVFKAHIVVPEQNGHYSKFWL